MWSLLPRERIFVGNYLSTRKVHRRFLERFHRLSYYYVRKMTSMRCFSVWAKVMRGVVAALVARELGLGDFDSGNHLDFVVF